LLSDAPMIAMDRGFNRGDRLMRRILTFRNEFLNQNLRRLRGQYRTGSDAFFERATPFINLKIPDTTALPN
jgi:hypothetical protein